MLKQRFRVGHVRITAAVALFLLVAMAVPGHAAPIALQPASHGVWASLLDGVQHQLTALLGLGGPRVTPPASGRHVPAPQATTQSGGTGAQPNSAGLPDPNGLS